MPCTYSTGTSGSGADVDKVRAATELVRQREPDLLVEGPTNRRPPSSPSVAATKIAGLECSRPCDGADLSRPQHGTTPIRRGSAARVCDRDRPVLQGLTTFTDLVPRVALVEDIAPLPRSDAASRAAVLFYDTFVSGAKLAGDPRAEIRRFVDGLGQHWWRTGSSSGLEGAVARSPTPRRAWSVRRLAQAAAPRQRWASSRSGQGGASGPGQDLYRPTLVAML